MVVDPTRNGALRVLGRTYAGRVLAILVAPDNNGITAYVITARTADDDERRRYQRREGRG